MTKGSRTIVSHSPDETVGLGREVAGALREGDVVLLHGSIGAGKSVLARGMIQALGAPTWRGSPTFALVNEYESKPPSYHIDLYRLARPEVEELGLEDYVRPDSVTIVEWADRAAPYLAELAPAEPLWIEMFLTGPQERSINLRGPARILRALDARSGATP